MPKSAPSLAVIVVTYNTCNALRSFLASAQRELAGLPCRRSQIVVVDNASQDGTRQMVTRDFPQVLFLDNGDNLGPARSFNRGLRAVLPWADLVVLANSDVEIHPGTLAKMLHFLEVHPDVDGCCGRLYNSDGSPQFTRTQLFTLKPYRPERPDWATFPGTTFSMLRSSCFFRIGGFDEVFYFYNEDLEWAERAHRSGLRFYYLPEAGATHHSGLGRTQNTLRIAEELPRADLYFFRRYYSWLTVPVYWQRRLWVHRMLRRSSIDPETAARALHALEKEYRCPTAPAIPQFDPADRDSGDGVDNHRFAFITCVNDEEQYAVCRQHIGALEVPPGYSIELIAIRGAKGMASGYNRAMTQTRARYKIYVHQDVYLLNKRLLFDVLEIFRDPRVGMIGVVGATRLPKNGVWFRNNPFYCYGKLWEYRKLGGPGRLLGGLNRRRRLVVRFREVRKPVLPVVCIDGLLMITQYDLPWRTDLYDGFIYYEAPQCLEFILRGYQVVVPRQDNRNLWCMHYGPPEGKEKTPEERRAYDAEFDRVVQIFLREYGHLVGRTAEQICRGASR
ncbi:MAG: glycosyltransferase [Firmicutes bacterium]|nr:glycosyltransferase [Bacillota bacterium]